MSVGKEKLKYKNDLTSLDDKLRIANKVNEKYLALENEKIEKLKDLCFEFGVQSEEILSNSQNHSIGIDKGKIWFSTLMDGWHQEILSVP